MNLIIKNSWVFFIMICPFIFFFTPKIDKFSNSEISCFKKINYEKITIFIHNCDAHSITSSSENFSNYLFDWEDNPWKGRPIHILLGTALSPIIYPFSLVPKSVFFNKLNYNGIRKNYLSKLPIYMSFYLVNFFLLVILSKIAFFILNTTSNLEKVLISILFSTTDMVNAWFWTGHSIFFGHIIPLVGLFSFLIGFYSNEISSKRFISFALILGLGCLIYQMSIIWIGMFIFGLAFKNMELLIKKKNLYFVATFLAPIFIWMILTFSFGMSIFFEASKHSQFMWLFKIFDESYRDIHGNFLNIITQHLLVFFDNFSNSFGYQWIPSTFLIMYCIIKKKIKLIILKTNPIVLASISIFIIQCLFNFIQDENQTRFINPLITVLTLVSLWLFKNFNKKSLKFAICFLIFFQMVFAFSKPPISLS